MGRLVSLEEARKESLIYFRELEYYDSRYQFKLKKEYPYAACLHVTKTQHLVAVRETMEQQCRSIAIYHYVEMDYQYPNNTDRSYGDTTTQRHGYYVIRCQLEEDQMILKLKIPELDKPQIFHPRYQDWHSAKFEAYNRMCETTGSHNYLSYQWEKLNKTLSEML
jgi:hypothetical protein